jgi:uncharacterized membrane protein YeaQ/YmgE (transglycosylase-associated protein family)
MSLVDEIALATEHPVAQGAAALLALLAALLAPVVGGWLIAEHLILMLGTPDTWLTAYACGVVGAFTGVWLFNRVLYGTRVYDWLTAFVRLCRRTGVAFEGGEA